MTEPKRIYAVRNAEENTCKHCKKRYTILKKLTKCSCGKNQTKGKANLND
jgi:hypothetical protein